MHLQFTVGLNGDLSGVRYKAGIDKNPDYSGAGLDKWDCLYMQYICSISCGRFILNNVGLVNVFDQLHKQLQVQGVQQSKTAANLWHQKNEEKNRKQRMQDKQTNAREAYTLFSPSEMFTILNGTDKHENNRQRWDSQHEMSLVKTTKPHKIRITPGPSL